MMRSTVISLVAVAGLGCSDLAGLAGKQELPAGVPNPNTFSNAAGAVTMYNTALADFQNVTSGGIGTADFTTQVAGRSILGERGAFVDFVIAAGLLSDEFQSSSLGGTATQNSVARSIDPSSFSFDARQLSGQSNFPASNIVLNVYKNLQTVRAATNQAIGALSTYAPAMSPALRGQMYALQGYAAIMLADLYCSGIPLSTQDFHGDFTYQAGSTTSDVYRQAAALLDSAITLSADSARTLNLARIGLGRARLALGQYADAAQAVADVPDNFAYQFSVSWGDKTGNLLTNLDATMSDQEGGTGLPYLSSNDPRTLASAVGTTGKNTFGALQFFPQKYGTFSTTANVTGVITVANGIEARLTQAEAALNAGDVTTWLRTLNTLRTTCPTAVGCATPAPAGTGQVAGLAPLTDPGSDTARVSLLFRERAFWLYATGHRQGDLRRLIRQYGREANAVYPTGSYPGGFLPTLSTYGNDVTVPIPDEERANTKFTGCLDRGA